MRRFVNIVNCTKRFFIGTKRWTTELSRLSLAAVLFLLPVDPGIARSLFELDVIVDGSFTASAGFNDPEDFINQFDNQGLEELVPEYTPDSAVIAKLDIRGLPATASYPANSTALRLQVPCAKVDKTFEGATRDESQRMMRDFLKANNSSVTDISKCLVSDTPVDPIAGNPNSLVATMAESDYSIGSLTDAGEENLFGVGLRLGRSEASGFNTTSIAIPLNYVLTFTNPVNSVNPPFALIFDLPIRYLDMQGGDLFDSSFGFGVRVIPVWRNWSLTPLARAGIAVSKNVGALQAAYSSSVTSKVSFYFDDLRLAINNMVGYYKTQSIDAGDFRSDYNINNTIFRNGLELEGSSLIFMARNETLIL